MNPFELTFAIYLGNHFTTFVKIQIHALENKKSFIPKYDRAHNINL